MTFTVTAGATVASAATATHPDFSPGTTMVIIVLLGVIVAQRLHQIASLELASRMAIYTVTGTAFAGTIYALKTIAEGLNLM